MNVLQEFSQPILTVAILGGMLKYLVVDKLKSIELTLRDLVNGQTDHNQRITTMEVAMRMNGCMSADGAINCHRRRKTDLEAGCE